ncbi:MAG: S46 family peptidase, partial [Bacteroidetes bacterium]|nr:S46 family peptidase [Bacteroidota bacterium]
MKKIIYMLSALLLLASSQLKADEGMWLPLLLKKYNYEQMKAKGLKLTPEQLYDVNNSSLKDAIVWFNGGCTGEIISSQGLVLTNHHCGYDAIASNSTPGNNILDDGFWAKNNGEEKPIPGMWVSIVVKMEDMTDRVQSELTGIAEKDRPAELQKIFKRITDEAKKGTSYDAQMREMFKGNAYYLFLFQRFNDIRLVGTPPQSVGKFGGDADNWMWPRHTGDFSMFRIYVNKNNEATSYAVDNVPYKPKHHLPINVKGVKEGDYAMIYGFPGRTNRYEFSQGIELAVEKVNPTIVNLRDIRLKAWKEVMDKSEGDRLKLSADYASIANYWKYFIGQTEQLKRLKVYDQKKAMELE